VAAVIGAWRVRAGYARVNVNDRTPSCLHHRLIVAFNIFTRQGCAARPRS
jgi:hypothetical protein